MMKPVAIALAAALLPFLAPARAEPAGCKLCADQQKGVHEELPSGLGGPLDGVLQHAERN